MQGGKNISQRDAYAASMSRNKDSSVPIGLIKKQKMPKMPSKLKKSLKKGLTRNYS